MTQPGSALDAGRLRPLYLRFDDFPRVRAEYDPESRFGNAYLTSVLGPAKQSTARSPADSSRGVCILLW